MNQPYYQVQVGFMSFFSFSFSLTYYLFSRILRRIDHTWVCIRVCVWREREREKESERTTWKSYVESGREERKRGIHIQVISALLLREWWRKGSSYNIIDETFLLFFFL